MAAAKKLDMRAMSLPELVEVLSKCGGRGVTEESIRRDIDQGAPVNPNGTINLIHFTAWLVQQASG